IVAGNRKTVLNVGDRVPVASASYHDGANGGAVSTQYQYLDVGVNIECLVSDSGGKLELSGVVNATNIERREGRGAAGPNPVISQNKVNLDALMTAGKPEVVASIDDPLNGHKMQVEATVTKVE